MRTVVVYIRHLLVRGGGEKVCLALAAALASDPTLRVTVLTQEVVDPTALGRYFHIDLDRVQFVHAPAGPVLRRLRSHPRVPGLVRNVADEVAAARALRHLPCDVFVNNTHQSYVASPAPTGVLMSMFPNPLRLVPRNPTLAHRAYYAVATRVIRRLLHPGYRYALDSYTRVVANSAYTAGWVERRWGRAADVLYPICESMAQEGSTRGKVILHVGRFFPDFSETHHKKQDWLLERFLAMPELAERGWELHFVGGLLEDPISRGYLDELRRRAAGAPVTFHVDATFEQLRALYNRASVYWHATGFGHDEDAHPEKHEHFGISTVEAMSAGAIPVVISSAGQREIVRHEVDGYLWSTPAELEACTRAVAERTDDELAGMRAAATARAGEFGRDRFDRRVAELFGP